MFSKSKSLGLGLGLSLSILNIVNLAVADDHGLYLRCLKGSVSQCEQRVIDELNNQQCGVYTSTIRCNHSPADEKSLLCFVRTDHCTDPADGYIGGVCPPGKQMSQLKDDKLTSTWTTGGVFQRHIRSICK